MIHILSSMNNSVILLGDHRLCSCNYWHVDVVVEHIMGCSSKKVIDSGRSIVLLVRQV